MPDIAVINRTRRGSLPFLGLAREPVSLPFITYYNQPLLIEISLSFPLSTLLEVSPGTVVMAASLRLQLCSHNA